MYSSNPIFLKENNFEKRSSPDGLWVASRILMSEVRCSNPDAGSIYYIDGDCPGLGLLQKTYWFLSFRMDFEPIMS